ncbi:MAG: hypothetical protein JWR72_953 [Flavisolibacter sp.]|jgi:hypothetical protein|nr:hypothetical protein [Flavisolibacter sp.]
MSTKSFYDLDYIIELNEKRLAQYTSAYQKVLERLTNIILIYSAITIFLVPIFRDVFLAEIRHWLLFICFAVFAVLFLISVYFTIRLVIPVEIAYLQMPKRYYEEYRITYEQTIKNPDEIKILLKASYINELETALHTNDQVFRRKSSFYYNALMYALLSAIPYLICLGFHASKRDDKVQKVQIVNSEISSKLHKSETMENSLNKSNNGKQSSSSTTTATTQLPGVNNGQVISSLPKLIKENSQNSSNKKK